MNPYSRPSPRTASPANNLQTNPTRTNNQRHTSMDMPNYSTTPPYSDRAADESEGEMMSRGGDHPAQSDQKHYHKVNQVIQVPSLAPEAMSFVPMLTLSLLLRTSSQRLLLPSYPRE